jgi:NAD(P)-dependent dehydrogenase (short-subunit alcohol dehydrogenase family)
MKVVVITGSTRGIGYGLAHAFLERGCAVIINGRQAARVDAVVAELACHFDADRICGVAGDVADLDGVQALWDGAKARFGHVDIWVNNAGVENRHGNFWEVEPDEYRRVIETNLIGVMLACRVVVRGMIDQGGGHIYNMEGMGSDGQYAPGLVPYGTTKYALTYLTRGLVKETADLPVNVSSINPGMVVTDLLLNSVRPDRIANARRIFNILADTVDTVAPWLADNMLSNQVSGARIVWLTRPKIIGRFLMAPLRKRDIFAGTSWANNE